ncbi:MAG: hypothetical protein GOVbin406_40 [Prokaryotic dsDNA virus sp.]|nr:MAG: hypothetical protein GOVbin406_40 [Prokaryotic dsDNA virus sp.]|tara:strand:+ start:1373 stop:1837 length:465 start_codon:yes stop_codon:yes gene_type:complete
MTTAKNNTAWRSTSTMGNGVNDAMFATLAGLRYRIQKETGVDEVKYGLYRLAKTGSRKKVWQISEIAKFTTLTGATVRNYIQSGFLDATKIGHKWLVRHDEVVRVFGGLGIRFEDGDHCIEEWSFLREMETAEAAQRLAEVDAAEFHARKDAKS